MNKCRKLAFHYLFIWNQSFIIIYVSIIFNHRPTVEKSVIIFCSVQTISSRGWWGMFYGFVCPYFQSSHSRVDVVIMGSWWYRHLYWFHYFLHFFIWNISFCQIPAHYTSTASNIRNLPITPGLLYIEWLQATVLCCILHC